ncbi:MAG: hypothetical protein J6B74_07140 [Ruminococcus sp.]|nr:hypothetical protein [Ruminococcus sp.]
MSELSFRYCPICGGELESGKILLPPEHSLSLTQYVEWYSNEKIERNKWHISRGLLAVAYDKRTAIKKSGANVPAGYCEKCDRIFAEFDIREKYNPIGEETLPTYDMDYYEESTDNLYEDKIVSYDSDSYDEKYNNIGGYKIMTDSIKFNKSED